MNTPHDLGLTAQRYRDARRAYEAARDARNRAVVEADANGRGLRAISREAGIYPSEVHGILAKAGGDDAGPAVTRPGPEQRESNRAFGQITRGLAGTTIDSTAEDAVGDERILAAAGKAHALAADIDNAAHLQAESAGPELYALSKRAGSLQFELERLSR